MFYQKKEKKEIKFCLILVLMFIMLDWMWNDVHHYSYVMHSQEIANDENHKVDITHKMNPVFANSSGIDNIALITMVKDEEDIIFENLVWHFCVGFRKFVIVDNNSSDQTKILIEKFAKLTKDKAVVFIIDDPVFPYIQNRIMTGAYHFASSIWPEIEWVFPVDADEFWYTEKDLTQILKNVPEESTAISVLRSEHYADAGFYNFSPDEPFYVRIPYRVNKLSEKYFKVAIRAGNSSIKISMGNHKISYKDKSRFARLLNNSDTLAQKFGLPAKIRYASGNMLGLHMTEYHVRSVEHTHRKLYNGMRAVKEGQQKKMVHQESGPLWRSYAQDLEKYGSDAAKVRFEKSFIVPEESVYDPLPVDEAMKLFYEILEK